MRTIVFLTMAVALLAAPTLVLASAGTEGHGGDVVICPGKKPVMLDYFEASMKQFGAYWTDVVDLESKNGTDVWKLVQDRLGYEEYGTSGFVGMKFKFELNNAFQTIGPMGSWTEADLNPVTNTNNPYNLPPGCVRKTAALRQGRTSMFIDPKITALLDDAQLHLLYLHEGVYFVASEHGIHTAEGVRRVLREILRFRPNRERLAQEIAAIGGDSRYGQGIYQLKQGWTFNPTKRVAPQLEVVAIDYVNREITLRETLKKETRETQWSCNSLVYCHLAQVVRQTAGFTSRHDLDDSELEFFLLQGRPWNAATIGLTAPKSARWPALLYKQASI